MELIGELTLSNSPNERFAVTVNDVLYNCTQLWNTIGFWSLNIYDSDNIAMVTGVNMVSGIFILKQFPNVPFDFFIDAEIDPDRDTFPDQKVKVYVK